MTIKIETTTNGYKAEKLQGMIARFNKAVKILWPGAIGKGVTVQHFYYGDDVDMITIRTVGGYAHFNLTQKRVSLTGLSAADNFEYNLFKEMTYRDGYYKGNLLGIAGA